MAIALANVYNDDAYDIEVCLDQEYASAESLGTAVALYGDKIKIDHIPPYGFVAIELKK